MPKIDHKKVFEQHGAQQCGKIALEKLYDLFKSRLKAELVDELKAQAMAELEEEIRMLARPPAAPKAGTPRYGHTMPGSFPDMLNKLAVGERKAFKPRNDRTLAQQKSMNAQVIHRAQALVGKHFSQTIDTDKNVIIVERVK